jgi:type I restriction enzyme S subunit
VRGKLGRQHQGDVPAQKLWARIQDEHAASREGRRRGGRSQADEGDEPVSEPYPLPSSWLWCRLGDVAGHIVDGTHHTPKYTTEGIAFISAKDIRQGRLVFDNCKYISDEEFKKLAKRCRPKRGDLLVTKSGSIGEVAVVDGDRTFTLFESVALVPIVPSVDHEYAARVVYLGASGQFGKDHQKGVGVPHLHLVDLRRLPFPLPPLEEQKRIVAKVEHLMKLCDDLEAKLGRAEETAATLVEAVVSKMVA